MKTYLGFVAVSVFLLSCTNTDRDNPYDMYADNYIGNAFVEGSSSSVKAGKEPSSSSVAPSSSSVKPSSSSARPSSSSVAPSSSSNAVSSSSLYGGLCAGFENGTKRLHYGKEKEQFCDERDGKKYVYVKIGPRTWMAENLNYNATGSKCHEGVDSNCSTYGRLYDWSTAMGFESRCNYNTCSSQIQPKHRGVCPPGWRIGEWGTLTDYVGGSSTAGTKLKATSEWWSFNGTNVNGTDDYGFSALPGGSGEVDYYGSDRYFDNVGYNGYWWSTSENGGNYEDGENYAYRRYMSSGSDVATYVDYKFYLFSVRCMQD